MGGFYAGATAQPLQRQTILGAGVDPSQADASMGGAPQFSPSAGSMGDATQQPSRFQSILGSLGQWNQNRGSQPQNRSVVSGLASLGKNTGLFTL